MAGLAIVVSAVLVVSSGGTYGLTHRDTQDADERFTPATLVGVSNDIYRLRAEAWDLV